MLDGFHADHKIRFSATREVTDISAAKRCFRVVKVQLRVGDGCGIGIYSRDVFDIGPAQRVDLALRTGSDGFYASGPGVWLMHDHAQPAATNKGINPGGDHTAIVYDGFLGEDGLPLDPNGHPAVTRRSSTPTTTRAGSRYSTRRSSGPRRRTTSAGFPPRRPPAAPSPTRSGRRAARCRAWI